MISQTKPARAASPLDYGRDAQIRAGAIVCAAGLGGFLLWGGLAPLEEGVAAYGQIVVEEQRKVVQHLEGGIIEEILVREGQRVSAGDPVVVLRETVSLAARDQVIQEYAALKAAVVRLEALQSYGVAKDGDLNIAELDFSDLNGLDLGAREKADILDRARDLFSQQKEAHVADIGVLEARRDAAKSTQAQRAVQIKIAERSLRAANDELAVTREMYSQQLARRNQVTRAEQTAASLEGDIARLNSERQGAGADERDLDAQITQAKARFAQDLSAELLETRSALLATEERLNAAQDVLDRAVIKAPATGEILNLDFATVGGVVRPGETIMEVIPDVGDVTASIKIKPTDRASVFEGQAVRTQIAAYKGWAAPRFDGEVVDISADLKTDPATSVAYYEARVVIPRADIAAVPDLNAIPGMPVDAFIYSGRSRTMFDYLLEPLGESLFRGLRSS